MTRSGSTLIAIDGDKGHLATLTAALGRKGATCHIVHFTGDATVVPRCPDVRIVLADLPLGDGFRPSDTDFGTIGHLLEDRICPASPYCVVLWTADANQAPTLATFLERFRRVPRPVSVRALDKTVHLDAAGDVKDEDALLRDLEALAGGWLYPGGGLALAGAWGDIDDQEVDALIEEIYASRRGDAVPRIEP